MAIYHSASRLITILEIAMKEEPRLFKRTFTSWFNTFSGVVAVCFLVSRAPHAPVATMAIEELQKARRLFAEIAEGNPRATRAQRLLERLVAKAIRTVTQYLESRNDVSDDIDGKDESPLRARWPAISDTRSRPVAEPETDPFEHAHPFLLASVRYATERMRQQSPFMFMRIPEVELSVDEDIRSGSFTTLTPSRVGNQSLNLDFGALTLGPDDRSLMTWF